MFKIKKTSKTSDFKKKPRCRAFYGVVFSVILFLGLFNGFLTKNAFASNNYIDNISFTYDDQYRVLFHFHVKTTFNSWCWNKTQYSCFFWAGQGYPNDLGMTDTSFWEIRSGTWVNYSYSIYWAPIFEPGVCPDTTNDGQPYCPVFQAGNYYTTYLGEGDQPAFSYNTVYFRPGYPNPQTTKIVSRATWNDNENYSWAKELPTLTITYPHNNDEIAGAFYVQGSYTIPASSTYYALLAGFFPVGTYDPHNFNRNVGAFNADIAPPSGNFSIPNWQLPAGYYDVHFRFIGIGEQYDAPEYISNIHLVNDIPPSLPTGETPPTIPVYPATSPETYHASYCSYGTSTTPLFNTLTGAVGGLITNIGQSLADFADRFKLTDAQNTGQQLANSVLLMRSYVATLNSFFGDLPVSQILILYLIVFVLVILFRLIKSLINLIKP